MKFCSHCGAEIADDTIACKCGHYVSNFTSRFTSSRDAPSGGFAVLGFFLPLVGLILFLVWNDSSPQKAKSCGKGALIGFIVSVVISIVATCVSAAAITGAFSSYF
jgi:hypothetical protein